MLLSHGYQRKTYDSHRFGPLLSRKYSKVSKWTLNLAGGGNRIAVIRASGSISRKEGGGLGAGGDGIASDTFIDKIRLVRGMRAFTVPYSIVFYNSEHPARFKINSMNNLTRIEDQIIVYFEMIMISFGLHAIRPLD